jgi:hypothetical protein
MKKITARNDVDREKKRGPGDMRSMPVETANKKPGGGRPMFTKIGGGTPSGFQKVGVAVKDTKSTSEEKPVETTQEANIPAEQNAQGQPDPQLAKLLKEQEEVQLKIAKLQAEAEAKAKAEAEAQATVTKVPVVPGPAPAEKQSAHEPSKKETELEDVAMGGTEDDGLANEVHPEVEPDMDIDDDEEEEEEEEEENITWEQYDFTRPTGCDHNTCVGCKTDGIWEDNFLTT